MTVTAEFFINKRMAESILHIKKYIWNTASVEAQVVKEEYDLNSWDDTPHIVDLAIDKNY